ncbi:MAG: hypothetical protein ABSH36_12195 [Solirubrobacteraceae bacterium]
MSTQCLYCAGDNALRHHPTGRDNQGSYLDSGLMLPFCHDHHELIHDDWRTLDIQDSDSGERSAPRLSLVERVELRLRRLAATAGRIAAAFPRCAWIGELARSFKRWADELACFIAALDRRDTEWRSDGSFFPAVV